MKIEHKSRSKEFMNRNKGNLTYFIPQMIQLYEGHSSAIIQLNEMSSFAGIEKRRLYDLFNTLSALDVCRKIGTHRYVWEGMNQIPKKLVSLGVDIELNSMSCQNEGLFHIMDSPHIKNLTEEFVKFMIYYGIETFILKDIAVMMANSSENSKSLLRRLYLVAFYFERIGIISHNEKSGEYRFCYNATDILISVYSELKENSNLPEYSIFYQINEISEPVLRSMIENRKVCYQKLFSMNSSNAGNKSHNNNECNAGMELQKFQNELLV